MAVLLDTHVVLWYMMGDSRLNEKARRIIDAKSELFFSITSLWEISIKLNIGKLQLTASFDEILTRLAFIKVEILPISVEDTQTYVSLPRMPEHRDPFDRILVAQAINKSLAVISADHAFDAYPIQRVWA